MPPGTRGAAPERGGAREGNTPPCGPSGGTIRVRPRFAAVSRRAGPRAQEALRRHPGRCGKDPSTMPGACAAKAQSPCAVRGLETRRGPQGTVTLRYLLAPRCRAGAVCAATPIGPDAKPLPPPSAEKPAGGRSPCGPLLGAIEKRPPRARRPALPQPCAAVLSAKAGLTAGFGMGPGDPRLCGRARGGRSPAALDIRACQEPLAGATLAAAWRARKKITHRARCSHRGCEELGLLVPLG